ncbi:hypothetical protein Pth03_74570 [Planotetraspora thailandica]|uniref:Uncharacterized protein n=1 Tax=Planotetraspora thailandica TaxID=487172 RepID=A0A8J4DED2_9ACTN|nr:hypothetical protein Pth03_74570 [Planotetraspora thailandica]
MFGNGDRLVQVTQRQWRELRRSSAEYAAAVDELVAQGVGRGPTGREIQQG